MSLFWDFTNAAVIGKDGSIIFIPKTVRKCPEKQLEPFFLPDKDKAVCLACCGRYIFSVGLSGRVFEYDLTEIKNDKLCFTEVKSLKNIKICEVSGSYCHCFAVSEEGKVFAFGSNFHGQLGKIKEIKKSFRICWINNSLWSQNKACLCRL